MNLSIFEKLSVLFELITSSPFTLFALLLAVFIFVSLFINLYVNKKYIKLIFPIIYILFIGLLLFNYHANIIKGFELFIDDLFLKTYFPSIALYFTMLFVNALGLFVTIFSSKITKYSKMVTIFCFSALQFLFALFFFVISEQHLALSDWTNLYQNKEILSILEVSMATFLLWIFLLFVGFGLNMINKYGNDNEQETGLVNEETMKAYEEKVNQYVVKIAENLLTLKKQVDEDRNSFNQKITKLETLVSKNHNLLQTQIQEVTGDISSRELLSQVKTLQKLVYENYRSVSMELDALKENPTADVEQLQQKVHYLEGVMTRTNEQLLEKLKRLEARPDSLYDVEKLDDRVQELEQLLKRYIVDMNYQLLKTRQEITIANHNRRSTVYSYKDVH